MAMCVPPAIVGLRVATGYVPGDEASGDVPAPVLAVAIASFILVPMLALTGAAAALIVAATGPWRTERRWWRSLFLLTVGAWALAAAVMYDILVIPEITA